MVTSELIESIRKERDAGRYPLLVNGTAGTTVLGAIDDLDEIADVCEREGLWLHVDASIRLSFNKKPECFKNTRPQSVVNFLEMVAKLR